MTPAQRAGGVTIFAVIVGIVGGWLFTPIALVVLPVLYVLALHRYSKRDA